MKDALTLPREVNPARVLSVFARSLRLARKASKASKSDPANKGAAARRKDRVLACYAQSRRVRFVRVYGSTLRGAARTASVRKAARQYRNAVLAWQRNYFVDSGF